MTSPQREFFVYLDHTFLDWFAKGRLTNFPREKGDVKIVPVYSQETLEEISRSRGYEGEFLDALVRLDAKYLVPHMVAARFADTADLISIDPHAQYEDFLDSRVDVAGVDVLLMGLAQAFSGDRPDRNADDLLVELRRRGLGMAKDALNRAKGLENLPEELQLRLDELQLALEEAQRNRGSRGVTQPYSVEELDRNLVGGAVELNNIRPPNVVEQIWERMPDAIRDKLSIGAYFGAERDGNPRPSQAEKAQAVFNMLGVLGYFRDPKLKHDRRMQSLMSDMGHVAFATYCDVFATRDERLARRAAAAYDFVGCPTAVILRQSILHRPSKR